MNETVFDTITTALGPWAAVALVVLLVGTLVALMERTHRRSKDTVDLVGATFTHPKGGRDRDLERTLDELRAAAGRDPSGAEPGPGHTALHGRRHSEQTHTPPPTSRTGGPAPRRVPAGQHGLRSV